MKNLKLSLITVVLLGGISYGGGEFITPTTYEIEDEVVAEEFFVEEPIYEEEVYVEPKPVYVEPQSDYIVPTPKSVPIPEPVVIKPKPVVVLPPVVKVRPKPKPKNISTNGFYAGIGITGVKYENNCKCKNGLKAKNKDTTYGIVGRVGYDFNEYIGVEARGSRTDWDNDGSKVKHAGVYVKPMLPIGNSSNLYGLVGVAKTTVNGRMPTVNAEGLALGVGVEVDLSKDSPKDGKYARDFDGHGDQETGLGVFVDYERMHVKSNSPDLDAISAGVTYDF
jgi:OOP family OmpA-OmpF porin